MRRNFLTIFSILLSTLMILGSGCVTQSQTPKHDSVIMQVESPLDSPYIDFYEVVKELPSDQINYQETSAEVRKIFYFTGIDLNRSGSARSWIFGLRHDNRTQILAYEQNGMIVIPGEIQSGLKETAIDSIISPDELFSRNSAVIFGDQKSPDRIDIEYQQGTYTLRIISGNTSRALTFNATTGELIRQ